VSLPLALAVVALANPGASPKLWATVNVCDTAAHPDTIGVRAQMPGTGHRGQRMYMRIQVEYLDAATNAWRPVGTQGDSFRFYVGAATHKLRQGGMSFAYNPPASGTTMLRGNVTFEWRRGSRVVYQAQKYTEAGHADAAQADPPGFSAAACEIRP
jgi:hypothetical protein